jgi:hypothetical protein
MEALCAATNLVTSRRSGCRVNEVQPVMRAVAAAVLLLLVGCSTDPAPAGPDTWMLSTSGGMSWASGGELTAELLRRADTFCRGQSRQMLPVSTSAKNSDVAQFGNASLYFRCLAADDPELHRPTMRTRPDVVIENRAN